MSRYCHSHGNVIDPTTIGIFLASANLNCRFWIDFGGGAHQETRDIGKIGFWWGTWESDFRRASLVFEVVWGLESPRGSTTRVVSLDVIATRRFGTIPRHYNS